MRFTKRSAALAILAYICAVEIAGAADLPPSCSRSFIPVQVLICGVERCSAGELIHLTGPSKDESGQPVTHSTTLNISSAKTKYIIGGFVLNVGALTDAGYFKLKLSTLPTKGTVQIESEAAAPNQAPAHIRLCLLIADRPLGPHSKRK